MITFDKDQKAVSSQKQSNMSLTTDASDGNGNGDTQAKHVAGPKTHPNLSIVYVDHELDKTIAESTDDEADIDTSRHNLTVVYIDHHLDGSVPSDNSQGSDGSNLVANQDAVMQSQQGLFRLPPELRIIIWELILPGKRLLRARAWYGRDRASHLEDGSSKISRCQGRWYFRVYDWDLSDVHGSWPDLEIPNVLAICQESRSVALRHGSFTFGRRDKSHDTGTWWNPNLDVLGFDHLWDLKQHPWALQHLQGLEHVKNLAIDERQAWTMCYNAGYNGEHPSDIPRKLRQPLAVKFEFRESDNTSHYILEFFPHFQQLIVLFSTIYTRTYRDWLLSDPAHFGKEFDLDEGAFSVTFRLGSDMETAVKELREYRRLCMKTEVREPRDFEDPPWDTLTEGPVYSVKNDDVDIEDLDHWMGAGFGMCQADQEVPI